MEAERLAIYFEEIGAYQHKKNKELQEQSNSSSGSRDETVVEFTLGNDEAEDEEDE